MPLDIALVVFVRDKFDVNTGFNAANNKAYNVCSILYPFKPIPN